MPNTPNLSLPYPVLADTADVPRDIQALATKLDGMGVIGAGLPASPTDGQECFVLADATNGIVWHFRYRAASASTYKWEFVGGPGLYAQVITTETTTSTTYVALTTPVTLTLPLAGDYDVDHGCRAFNDTANANAFQSVSFAGAAASANDEIAVRVTAANNPIVSMSRNLRKTGLTASTVALRYRADLGTGNFLNRWLRVTPIRVG